MPTQINQIRDEYNGVTILRVEGDMLIDDAILIKRIAQSLKEETGDKLVLDLADLDFLDSEAASVLRNLEDMGEIELQGLEIFLQSAIDMAERA